MGLEDVDLKKFIKQLNININANDYISQINHIINSLQVIFECSEFEAEHFFYNNAVRFIKDTSTNASKTDRTVSKKDFLNAINTREILFNEWFVIYKGRKLFLQSIKNQYFPSELNTSPFERFFLIDIQKHKYDRSQVKELIFLISKKWGNAYLRLRRSSSLFCPYIYLHNITEDELISLKHDLHAEGHKFSDGYDFHGASFSPHSIYVNPDNSNGIKVKIINEIKHLNLCLDTISKTKEVYQFYLETPFFEFTNPRVKHIQIPIQNIQDAKEVI